MIAGSECRDASCHCFWKYTCSVLLRDRKQQSPQIPHHALLCPTLRREKMPCPGTDRLPVSLTVHLQTLFPAPKELELPSYQRTPFPAHSNITSPYKEKHLPYAAHSIKPPTQISLRRPPFRARLKVTNSRISSTGSGIRCVEYQIMTKVIGLQAVVVLHRWLSSPLSPP
jgi:hypothetical protein